MFKVFTNFQNYIKKFQDGGSMEIEYFPTKTPLDEIEGYAPQFRPYAPSFSIASKAPEESEEEIMGPYYPPDHLTEMTTSSAVNNFSTGRLSLKTFVDEMKPAVDAALRRAGVDTKFSPMLLANMAIETGHRLSGSVMYNDAFNFSGIHSNKKAVEAAGYKYYGRDDYKTGTVIPGAGVGGRDAIYVPHGKRNDNIKHTSWWTKFKDVNDYLNYYVGLLKNTYGAFDADIDHVIPAMFLKQGRTQYKYGTAEHYPETMQKKYEDILKILNNE